MKPITIVIAENNEGKQINDSLDNLIKHNDTSLFNVVVVSDGSDVPLDLSEYKDLVKHVKYSPRRGVGAAFDEGVKHVETPFLIISGSDIRFRDDNVLQTMIGHLWNEENARSIITPANLGINASIGQDVYSELKYKRFGARICMFLTRDDLPRKGSEMSRLKDDVARDNYRNILECKWMKKQSDTLYELPSVLGAWYGARKEWYDHIQGFRGHRYWGTLEPFISLKSWLAGGQCKLDPQIAVGHLFKSGGAKNPDARPSHVTLSSDLQYNKLAVSSILFSPDIAEVFWNYLGNNEHLQIARVLVHDNRSYLRLLHDTFLRVKERDIHWFYQKWGFKHYDLIQHVKDETRNS